MKNYMRGEAASFVVVFSACQKANSWIIISSQWHRVTSGQLASGRNYKNQSNHSQHFIPVLSLNSSNRKEIWVMSDQGTINNAESKTYRFFAAPNPPGNITASKLPAWRLDRAAMLPRAIRADSTRTFLQHTDQDHILHFSLHGSR